MTDWLRYDLRHAIRWLARRPGFSLLAILTLALGLGVNTVAFSAANALLFKPFRVPGAASAGWLFVGTARDPLADTSVPMFEAIRSQARTLATVAAEGRTSLALDTGGTTDQVWALVVSSDYFSVVQARPLTGRLIGGSDGADGGVPVLVSERFWSHRLGRPADLAHVTLMLNHQPAPVVGVLPDDFQGPGGLYEPDVWVPLAARHTLSLPAQLDAPGANWLMLLARPRPGATPPAVQGDVLALARGQAASAGRAPDEVRVQYVRLVDRHPEARRLDAAAAGGLAIVGVVLLIACFNVAGLILARSVERRRELGVRAALGASRLRLARQLLTEGLVLAAAGGVAAMLVASWSAQLLSVFALPAPIPQRLHFVTDWRLLLFAAALAALAAVIPALTPMTQVFRADLVRWLRAAGAAATGRRRTRHAFVVLQIAGSTFFLALALVFARNFAHDATADRGFDARHIATLEIDPSQHGYPPARTRDLADRVAARMAAQPGVEAVALANWAPFLIGSAGAVHAIAVDARDCRTADCVRAGTYAVGAHYFAALGVPLVAGRALDPANPRDANAAVVNAVAAERLWPGQSPLGRSFRVSPDGPWLDVVGVAGNIRLASPDAAVEPVYFTPFAGDDWRRPITVVVRTSGDPAALVSPLRQAVRAFDADLPADSAMTMTDRMAVALWIPKTTAGFFGVCGALAMLLSTIGLFGVTYYAVSRRTREFGVRFALGASRGDVQRLVLREALRLAAPGILIGGAAAVAAGFASRALLVGLVQPAAGPYLLAIVIQAVVTVAACWSPAVRAGRASPLAVLRAE
jgi:putative ABC transport system permease protein